MTPPRPLARLAASAGLLAVVVGSRAAVSAPAPPTPAATAAPRPPVTPVATRPAAVATREAATAATAPATRPGTQPAHSLDSPRDALKWFAAALRDGDAARLRAVVLTTTEAEDRMVGAMGDMARALAGLHAAAARQYGPEVAGRFSDDTAANFEQTLARIDAADVAVDGDAATVRYPESPDRPYTLRRVGPAWRLPAAHFSQGAPPEAVDRQVGELVVQTRIVNELAGEVAAGRHKNADAASQAWRSRMMSALGGQRPGPGGPATGPATTAPGAAKPKG